MAKGKRNTGKSRETRGAVKRGRVTSHDPGKKKVTASWTPSESIQEHKSDTQLAQASKLPRPCIKKFLAELEQKIINTPMSTYFKPRRRRMLPSASHMVYSFWDGCCFQTPLVDCQDELRGPAFLDSHIFKDLAQPVDELYVLELLHSIDYASATKTQKGVPEVAPHALELLRRAPASTPLPTSQTPCADAVPQVHGHINSQAQSLEAMPHEDFLEQLSEMWRDLQEDPERAARQRGFDEAFIATAFDFKMPDNEVATPAKKPSSAQVVEEDPEEPLDDAFLANFFASAEEEVAPALQQPAATVIDPFQKEPPAESSLHMYSMELPSTSKSGPASTEQQEDACFGLVSVQDAAELVAELVAKPPAKYLPQISQPSTSVRTMRHSDIKHVQQQLPVPERAVPSPIWSPGGTPPPAARCHPCFTPPSARPAKCAKRMTLQTAPSVGPGLLPPLEDSPPLTAPQNCAPLNGAGTINDRPEAAGVSSKRTHAPAAKRKAADAACEVGAQESSKMPRVSHAELPTEAHEALHPRDLTVQRGKRSPQARRQQTCPPRCASMADEAWRNLLFV